jgi:nucleoid DNA-binding protein
MTQTQMAAYLAKKIGITKQQAKSTFDELNELVTRQIKKEGSPVKSLNVKFHYSVRSCPTILRSV